MAKNLLYRLFGLRKLPAELRRELQLEGIVFDEEGTSCALRFRNFKGPASASHRGWESAHPGSLLITTRSFYVALPHKLSCRKPIEFAAQHLDLELKGPKRLLMTFDVEALFDDATGEMSCLWRTENAKRLQWHLEQFKN